MKYGSIYDFDTPVERRGTGSLKWDSIETDLLPMWVADMDFPASPAIQKALAEKLNHGVYGYGFEDELPGILCKWFKEEYDLTVEESWIVLLPAIVPTLTAVSHLRPGRSMINIPNYNALLSAPLRAGKETVLSPLKNTNEFYEMDFDDMQSRLEPDIKLLYFCNPHNPVGRVYTKDELLALSRFCRKNNLIVISDEVHCGLVFDRAHIPYFSIDDYAFEQSITIMGHGKTFNIPGLPFAFAVVPDENLRKEFQAACYALPHQGILSVCAARAAYAESRDWKNVTRQNCE